MQKMYCDKCRKEITKKKSVRISVGYAEENRIYGAGERVARLELCDDCYKELGIEPKVNGCYVEGDHRSSEEALYDLIRELVQECVQEFV